jgi:hypothetical protein
VAEGWESWPGRRAPPSPPRQLGRLPPHRPRPGPGGLLPPNQGVRVSSPARSWTLRSSAPEDADTPPGGCRTIRTTWRLPPQGQGVADGPCGEAAASECRPQR